MNFATLLHSTHVRQFRTQEQMSGLSRARRVNSRAAAGGLANYLFIVPGATEASGLKPCGTTERYGFRSIIALPLAKSTGTESCSWTISHLPLILR